MNNYRNLILILMFLASILSCKKGFLDVPDRSILLRQVYITDLTTTTEYLNGVYVLLTKDFYKWHTITYPELIADNIKPGSGLFSSHYAWAQKVDDSRGNTNASTVNMNRVWQDGYKIIRECNFILENIDKYRSENVDKADDVKGQAFAIRALMHFVLVNTFAQPYNTTTNGDHVGVPYIISSDWRQAISRQKVGEVYGEILYDLKRAVELLPTKPLTVASGNKNSVININAAKALIARVCLSKGDYPSAKAWAREVGLAVPIMSASDYPSKLFTQFDSEALFQLPPVRSGFMGGTYNTTYAGSYYFYDEFLATGDIVSILRENMQDSRSVWVTPVANNWRIAKYPTNVVPGSSDPSASYYQSIFRSSEMYLIAAEAYAKLNNEDSARYYLNAIRKRANGLATSLTTSGIALLDSIYKERRKELAFEGLRMFDLLRLKLPVNRIDAPNANAKNLPYPSSKAVSPIPLSDVNLSGLTQNSDY